MEVSLRFAVL